MKPFRCCLNTSDPGPWRAGVDDRADLEMIDSMHKIRDGLSSTTPIGEFIWQLETAVQIDSRTRLGGDIQRCLLSNAADRLMVLAQNIDPRPWRTLRERIRDALDVFRGRAVAIRVRGTVYEMWRDR